MKKMDDVLKDHFVTYLNNRKPTEAPCDRNQINCRSEVIDDELFDIKDKEPTIKQRHGSGSATYNNPQKRLMAFIDYEGFINNIASQVAADLETTPNNIKITKDIKRCDFIGYDMQNQSIFILNELSQSGTPKSKYSDARSQLNDAVQHLTKCIGTKSFIDAFAMKKCIFSNKYKTIQTSDNIAEAFNRIRKYLPEPIERDFQPITKHGFKLIETAIIDV